MNNAILGIWVAILLSSTPTVAIELPPAIDPGTDYWTEPSPRGKISESVSVTVNVKDRADVVRVFNEHYLPFVGIPANWTGNVDSCVAGTNNQNYTEGTLRRINYFRAMAQLNGDVVMREDWNTKCQEAALMMAAKGGVPDHNPTSDWKCYTAGGREAAGSSNLANGNGWHGPAAIDGYMDDPGQFNINVGHRRAVLCPGLHTTGVGSTTYRNGSNAQWWVGGFNAFIRNQYPEYLSWPPAGYVPYQVVYNKWHLQHDTADFSQSQISMTRNGSPISSTRLTYGTSSSLDNHVIWTVGVDTTQKPSRDMVYGVTVSGIKVGSDVVEYSYEVTIIDPAQVVNTPTPTPTQAATPTPTAPALSARVGDILGFSSFWDPVELYEPMLEDVGNWR